MRVRRGPLDPEFLEDGKFLAAGLGGVEGETAGRKPVNGLAAKQAEVAGPEKGAQFVAGLVQIVKDAETRETHRVRNASGQIDAIIDEQVAVELDVARPAAVEFVQLHRVVEDEAGMEELQLERQPFPTPPGVVRVEADPAVFVIAEVAQELRHLAFAGMIRLRGELLGVEAQGFEIEGFVLRPAAREAGQNGGQNQPAREELH